ncbi:MAG: gliding motility lipoprotein GldH [bacterium]
MRKIRLYFLVLAAALMTACDGNVFYSEYSDVDADGWLPTDSVCFDVDVEDTSVVFDFLVEVRNSVSYPYSNTFLFIGTTFPDGSVARDTLECPLAAPTGEWYGKRSGRYVDSRYYFRRNARFPMSGSYRFAITNGMRDSAICGMEHIGFRIEYSQMNQ